MKKHPNSKCIPLAEEVIVPAQALVVHEVVLDVRGRVLSMILDLVNREVSWPVGSVICDRIRNPLWDQIDNPV